MHITALELRNFRNYERTAVALENGVTVIHGSVGAGKTNLLEAVYFGAMARSFRTSNDRELVRFGERSARVALNSVNSVGEHRFEVGLEPGRVKSVKVDGVKRDRLLEVEGRPLMCVFMPDRLELVKGPGAARRGHVDSVVAALRPAQRDHRSLYGRALAQRNVLLSRVRAGAASRSSLGSWNRELAARGVELMEARANAIELIAPHFARHAAALGLSRGPEIRYRPASSATTAAELEAELEASIGGDVQRGFTYAGPHRDDLRIEEAGRELRRFGSQGQQRLALLALLLAERDALEDAASSRPVLLLDDVMSELDQARRRLLLDLLLDRGQTLITTADPSSALPGQVEGIASIEVSGGRVDG